MFVDSLYCIIRHRAPADGAAASSARKDPTSGKYVDIPRAAFAQKSGISTDTLTIYPGIAETATRKVSNVLPKDYRIVCTRIVCTIGGSLGPNFTFSLGFQAAGG